MIIAKKGFSISRNMRFLLVGLIAVSTILYVVGVTLELNGEKQETPAIQQAPAEGQPGHSEASESSSEVVPSTQPEAAHQEALFGVNLESPWFIAAAVIGAIVLIGIVLRFERIGLILTIVFAIAATLLDILEVITQVNRSNSGLAAVAVLVTLAHIAVGVLSVLILRRYSLTESQTGAKSVPA